MSKAYDNFGMEMRLRELDPDADKIIAMWTKDPDISDREIARRLGREHSTFQKQIARYRSILKDFQNL